MNPVARSGFVVAAAGVALAGALPLLAGASAAAATDAAARTPVVVVGAAPLRWADVGPQATPQLWHLAATSTLGSLSVKAADPVTCPDDGWLTLGAGNRATAGGPSSGAAAGCGDAGLRVEPAGGKQAGDRQVGERAIVAGFTAAAERNLHRDDRTHLGALADALKSAGQCISAAGRPAALAAADSAGHVAAYLDDALAAASDPAFLSTCPVTLIAAGTSELDAVLGALQRSGVHSLLLVVGVGEPFGEAAHLHVALARGASFDGGELISASTRRAPFVQLVDVAPTILHARGVTAPSSMIGQRWQEKPDRTPLADEITGLRRLDVAARHQVTAVVPFWATVAGLSAVACVLAWWVAHRATKSDRAAVAASRRLRRFAALGCTWCALLPATSFLVGVVSWWSAPLPLLVLGLSSLAGATVLTRLAVALEVGIWHRRAYGLAAAAGAITFAAIALDLVTGAHLQISTMAGYSPLVAGRFAGIGNVAFGVFAAGALLLAAGVADVSRRRPRSRISTGAAVAIVGVIAVAVDGAPPWGSDVGGVLALVPGFGVLFWLASDRRLSWRRIVAVVALACAVIVVLGAIDYARPAADQTHLGRFVGEVLHGGAWTVVRRKAIADFDLLTHSALTLLIPLLVVVAAWLVIVPGQLLRGAFARVAVLRPVAVALLVMAVVGAVLNDSGVAIPALAALVAVPATMTVLVADLSGRAGRGETAETSPGLLR